MFLKPTERLVVKVFGKIPLRTVLIVPFVLQIFAAVGLVGYLSFRNGQKAVNELADQLMSEISDRVQQNLQVYLATPHLINQSKLDAVKLGFLSMQNLPPWEKYLWQQAQLYPYIAYTGVGNEKGEYRSGEKLSNGSLIMNVLDKSTNFEFRSYKTNNTGDRTLVVSVTKNHNIKQHPAYKDTVKAGKSIWSPVYTSLVEPTLMNSVSQPVYDKNNQIQGVLVTALRFDYIGQFLNSLKIGKTGQAFIIEKNRTLLATSTSEQPFRTIGNKREVFKAQDSSNFITKNTARYLITHFSDLNPVQKSQPINFGRRGLSQSVSGQEQKPQTTGNGQLTIHFEVEDTGPGIAPDELETLFEAFVQTQTGKQAQEGTGLGLPISRQFVQLMGGEMTVSSHVEQGSIFKFDIQVNVVDAKDIETQQPTRRVIGLEPNQPHYRILIVDDKPLNRQLLIQLLNPLGFQLKEASNGSQAIEIWDNWEPHLIWMDMRMPVMDGYEATQHIKSTTKGQATAIVALTASVLEEERAVILSAGCDGFMRKPFREADIFDAMHQHIGVRYLYENPEPANSLKTKDTDTSALTTASFRALSKSWVADLKQALLNVDLDLIATITEQIRSQDSALAQAISNCIDNFEYDQILKLISKIELGYKDNF